MRRIDLTGKTFGRLTVIRFVGSRQRTSRRKDCFWLCRCDHGDPSKEPVEIELRSDSLLKSKTRSCGCLRKSPRKRGSKYPTDSHQRLKRIWAGIKVRCYSPSDPRYVRYGAVGVKMFDGWKNDCMEFIRWAFSHGYRDDLTCDRYPDPSGDYSPENCRWATPKQQADNRRNTVFIYFKGKTKSVFVWAQELAITDLEIYARLSQGKSIEEVLSPEASA